MSAWVSLAEYVKAIQEDVPRTRWCHACACSQYTVAAEPCWQCGGTVSPEKPAWWPPGGMNQQVRAEDVPDTDYLSELRARLQSEVNDAS